MRVPFPQETSESPGERAERMESGQGWSRLNRNEWVRRIKVIQMIYHESNDVRVVEESEYGTKAWDKIDVRQAGYKALRGNCRAIYKVGAIIMRTGGVEMESNCVQGIQGG
jgi:deoxycytidylate deaminase